MRNDVERFLFLFFLSRPLARLHLPVNEKSRMHMLNLWRGRWRDLSRQRLSRLCLAKATWRGTNSLRAISDQLVFAAARHRPSSSHVRHRDIQIVPPRGQEERFGGHCESQCDAFQCKYLSALGTRRNRRNFMLLRNSTCSPYILSPTILSVCSPVLSYLVPPRPRYLITHPRVLRSALIFHCWSERNLRIS